MFKGFDDEIKVELATKRFEYTFESCWKVLQAALRAEGVNVATPLKCFKEAFKAGNIDEKYEELFVTMIEKRNQIVHVYDFDQAQLIYEFINSSEVINAFENIYSNLANV
ncbi:hypothetical protein MNBD_BACTEROID05-1310 [hydrothermal vent metagenome]|uniref:Nucleotidyltransferase n=1 Tax=hydrothermal vent metagenome TaxID=652676 RepID=A0A3B0TXA7_9ZZZZ